MDIKSLAKEAKKASLILANTKTASKNKALALIASELLANKDELLKANEIDLLAAKKSKLGRALVDRLLLDENRLKALAKDVQKIIELDDPIGELFDARVLASGLSLHKRRIPLGVIGAIYEARPNVTIDIASLCLKTGNACILRGGSESLSSNKALIKVIKKALLKADLPPNSVSFISDTDKSLVKELLSLDEYLDMIIPRGGPKLHKMCKENSSIPVIIGGFGISHIFIDESADILKSLSVVQNAKVQRPSACNSLDSLLIHEKIAKAFLQELASFLKAENIHFYACEKSYELLKNKGLKLDLAKDEHFYTEWLSLSLNIKILKDVKKAILHMQEHGAIHSDAIMSNDLKNIEYFLNEATSAALYVNASTRFSDGACFGLGAEVAVSTNKLHARGPMGLKELCTYKWIGVGEYLSRA